MPEDCGVRWWALENTAGYHLHSEESHLKVILNTTIYECYDAVYTYGRMEQKFRYHTLALLNDQLLPAASLASFPLPIAYVHHG